MKQSVIPSNTNTVQLQLLDDTPECEYEVQENSELTVVVYAKGEKSIDGSVKVHIVGSRSTINIYGVFITASSHQVKLHTLQHHDAPETTSNLLIKSVLRDEAIFSYDGAIRVEKTGQKTDAYQRNENLLLSPKAFAQSKPSLEILANDVRCTHGATIGNINEEQLFYLSTRGIDKKDGSNLIVRGFLDSVLSMIADPAKADQVREVIWQNL